MVQVFFEDDPYDTGILEYSYKHHLETESHPFQLSGGISLCLKTRQTIAQDEIVFFIVGFILLLYPHEMSGVQNLYGYHS